MRRVAQMKPDLVKQNARVAYADDVARIVSALAHEGIEASDEVADLAWRRASELYCAGWLALYDEDALLVHAVLPHLDLIVGETP